MLPSVAADEEILHRVEEGVAGFTEDRHKAIMKATQAWGKDTSATDKALRNCVLGTALSEIENMRIKQREQLDALTEVSTAAFSGYALGRELLGTETARPSYSSSEPEEKNNAIRIHDRSQAWPSDTLLQVFKASEPLMRVINSQASSLVFKDIVGARRAKATLLNRVVGSVAFAMAEDDLFGPFTA
jgi:hypothetical protein